MPNLRLEEAINDLENVYGSGVDTNERYLKINEEISSLRQISRHGFGASFPCRLIIIFHLYIIIDSRMEIILTGKEKE